MQPDTYAREAVRASTRPGPLDRFSLSQPAHLRASTRQARTDRGRRAPQPARGLCRGEIPQNRELDHGPLLGRQRLHPPFEGLPDSHTVCRVGSQTRRLTTDRSEPRPQSLITHHGLSMVLQHALGDPVDPASSFARARWSDVATSPYHEEGLAQHVCHERGTTMPRDVVRELGVHRPEERGDPVLGGAVTWQLLAASPLPARSRLLARRRTIAAVVLLRGTENSRRQRHTPISPTGADDHRGIA